MATPLNPKVTMPLFALATLGPLLLTAIGAVLGGPWIVLALVWMTALTATLDDWAARVPCPDPDAEFPGTDPLCAALALGQLALLAMVAFAFGRDALGPWEKAGLLVAAGLHAGQVGNANAHELIHRPSRALRRLGIAAYAAILFGHHASSHRLVHHRHVATRADPSTARAGESFYRFAGRAWRGSFRRGLRAESERLKQAGRPRWRHPYLAYAAISATTLAVAAALGGWAGLAAHLALGAFAQVQLLMSDYVQHYGLVRRLRPDGRLEPVAPRHSWNSPHPASSALMLNAPRHSDHHANPSRPYPALRLPEAADAPRLPRSLPVMACMALAPPLWRRVMDPLAAVWSGPLADR